MLKFKPVKQTKPQKKVWEYNQQPIDLSRVVYLRAEVWDNQPDMNAVQEKKRYKAKVNFYYKTPSSLADIKNPNYSLWGYCSDYHTFRNNRYKDDADPHKDWYESIVDKAKDINTMMNSNAVVMHGCLGTTQTHHSGNGFGPHNQPRYTVDVLHSLNNAETMGMILHMEEHDIELDLNTVRYLGTPNGPVRNFSVEGEMNQ